MSPRPAASAPKRGPSLLQRAALGLLRFDRGLREAISGPLSDPRMASAMVDALSGLAGGSSGRLVHPSAEVRRRIRMLRGGGRDIAAIDPYARQFLRLLEIYVPGPNGLQRRAQVKGAGGQLLTAVNDTIDAGWLDFWNGKVTTDGRLSGPAVEHMRIRTLAGDGEVLVQMFDGYPNRHGFALQFIDADQIDSEFNRGRTSTSNEVRMGIEIDEWGAAVNYYVRDFTMGSLYGYGRRRRETYVVSAYDPRTGRGDMLHEFRPLRANQARGLSWFSPVLQSAEDRILYAESELRSSIRAASVPWALEAQSEAAEDLLAEVAGEGKDVQEQMRKQRVSPSVDLDPEKLLALPIGWSLKSVEANHPSSVYAEYMRMNLHDYAAALGESFAAISGDRSQTTYSGGKMDEIPTRAWHRLLQQDEVRDFSIPVSRRWLANSRLKGLATDGREGVLLPLIESRDYTAADWDPPEIEWPEPLKEAQAAALMVMLGLDSRTEILSKLGRSFKSVIQRLKEEKEAAEAAGVSIDPNGITAAKINADAASAAQADETAQAAAAAAKNGGGKSAKALRADPFPTRKQLIAALLGLDADEEAA